MKIREKLQNLIYLNETVSKVRRISLKEDICFIAKKMVKTASQMGG